MKKEYEMSKRNTQSQPANIALKTIHNDIVKANANSTLTTKQMRVKLRAKMRDAHDHNASWMFTQSQYDVVRSMFDPAYATRIANAAKRATRAAAKPRTQSQPASETTDA